MRTLHLFLLLTCAVAPLAAAVSSHDVAYTDGDVHLLGTLSVPGDLKSGVKVPGILVVPEWWGCNDYAKRRAVELAEQGYVAFACDMYGAGKVTSDPKQAGEWAGAFYQDHDLLLRRAGVALAQLRAVEAVDGKRLAAVGFCFGGMVALELARAGEDLDGVVSYHGSLGTKHPAAAGAVTASLLVLQGGADPFVPPSDVAAFMTEMTTAKAVWRMEVYGGALHAFTNPAAAELHKILPGVDYDADAERRAFVASRAFLGEVLTAK